MRGLMSGRMAAQGPSAIPLSLMMVAQNALSHAWRILLVEASNGQFSICDNKEDDITERLYMILGEIYAVDPEVVSGFSFFETPVREGNLRNQEGDRLDLQPDLTFRPSRGLVSTSNSVLTGIFVECKPIDSRHPVGDTYCQKGISRFVCGEYAWAVDRAIMLAYVRNICPFPDGLAYVLNDRRAKEAYKVKGGLTLLGKTEAGDAVYCTVHDRENASSSVHASASATATATEITLHHLWLNPDKPCEKSKCRV